MCRVMTSADIKILKIIIKRLFLVSNWEMHALPFSTDGFEKTRESQIYLLHV